MTIIFTNDSYFIIDFNLPGESNSARGSKCMTLIFTRESKFLK